MQQDRTQPTLGTLTFLHQDDCEQCGIGKLSVSFDFNGDNKKVYPATTKLWTTCRCAGSLTPEQRMLAVAAAARRFYETYGG